ncbi:MAG TPA: Ig-like domain-containing protein, partial [Verrucomicrobiae bacterium]
MAQTTESVTLNWSASSSPNIVGYDIYYGGASGNYTNMISVGNVTTLTIPGLLVGVTYYFAATTVNSSGLQSGYSSQTSYTPPPISTTNSPLVSITNVVSGMQVSSATFTAMGNATDNIAVAYVYYSLDGALFVQAKTSNQWTNWTTASLSLLVGTNTVAAYAVDTSGNFSKTNTVSIVYVPNILITVQTNGQGNINPNYNGLLLQLGKSYSMTATAANGFMFSNWTGGPSGTYNLYTTAQTVTFTMISNLVLRANFVDTSKPWINITDVTPDMQVSNTVFTVTGQATDNVAVASVYFSLNGSAYTTVSVSGANWNVSPTLIPGTNTISAYAVDNAGNISTTDMVNLDCVVPSSLTVQTNGQGSITPLYNGSLLQIGKMYSLTAMPANGSMFINWTGGTGTSLAYYTNNPTVQFTMLANLTLQANFADTNKPWLNITNLTAGMQVSNATFTVMGQATDNVAVANVYYSLDGASYARATTNGADWYAALTLTPGTNTLSAYDVDTSGNISTTDTLNFVFIQSATLTVQTNGQGTIYSPYHSGSLLQLGKVYSMTAYAASGFIFTNWTGGANGTYTFYTNGPTVSFTMVNGLTMQANFTDLNKPWLSVTNVTSGMVIWTNSNFTVTGLATDDQAIATVNYSFNGAAYTPVTSTDGWTNWSASLALPAGTNTFSVYAQATNGNFSTTNFYYLVYGASNQLNLQTGGKALIYPNYSNAWLRVGQNYTTTAYPDAGFVFTNWTGGTGTPFHVYANTPTVTFMMQSNLTMQANFTDLNKPWLSVTNVTSGMVIWTN